LEQLRSERRIEIGRLTRCPSEIPTVLERVRGGDCHEHGAGHLTERQLHDLFLGAGSGECRERALGALVESGDEVVGRIVGVLGRVVFGGVPCLHAQCEPMAAAHDVVDDPAYVPRSARRRIVELIRLDVGEHSPRAREGLFE